MSSVVPRAYAYLHSIPHKELLNLLYDQDPDNDTCLFIDLDYLEFVYKKWCIAFPTIKPYYAMKCNPDKRIIQKLHALGAGFDCASSSEMEQVRSYDVDASNIILANTCKLPKDFKTAKAHNIQYMTFDNEYELSKILQYHPQSKLIMRIACGDTNAKIPFGNKFGAQRDSWQYLITYAQSLGLTISGVSFHVGSGSNNHAAYTHALKDASDLFQMLKENNYDPHILDIGGGFMYPLNNDVVYEVNQQIKLHFPNINVIAEPGRYFAENIVTHYAKVVGKSKTHKNEFKYWIHDSIYGCFADVSHGYLKPTIIPVNDICNDNYIHKPLYKTTIYGSTCDGTDIIQDNIYMAEQHIGMWLCTPHMGAYTIVLATPFNGMNFQDIPRIYREHEHIHINPTH